MMRDRVIQALHEHADVLRAAGVRELRLFGSVARDEDHADSDVDLLVEFDRPTGYFQLLRLHEQLEAILGRKVDLGTPDSLHHRIRDRVLRESIRAA